MIDRCKIKFIIIKYISLYILTTNNVIKIMFLDLIILLYICNYTEIEELCMIGKNDIYLSEGTAV